MILLELFLSFLQVGVFSIGGGYAAIPLIEAQAVDKYGWITVEEFSDLVTIAEMTPGPIAVNSATFVGLRIGGVAGAIVSTFGCILPSLIIVSVLGLIYFKYRSLPALQSVLSCLRPAVVALIASAGLTIFINMLTGGTALPDITAKAVNWVGLCAFAAAFFLLRKFKKNPIIVMLLTGVVGVVAGTIGELLM